MQVREISVVIFDFFGVVFDPRTGTVMAGLPLFLQQLRQHGKGCGVASSSISAQIETFLQEHALHDYFGVVIGADRVEHIKPNPECYLTVAEFFKVAPSNCLVIDDSSAALEQAKAAGFQTIYFGPEAAGGLDNFEKIAKLVGL